MAIDPDTEWTDDEIVMSDITPDTDYVFEWMTRATIAAVDARPGEVILDVACGRAIDAMKLARNGARVVGIEASDVMIDKALEFMGEKGEGVFLARSLAEDLPFIDGAFDKVVCKGAMDHFVDVEASMDEMARVTRSGGKVVIAIANFDSLTCRLGRLLWGIRERLGGTAPDEHPFWEPPDDHNFKFDLEVLIRLMERRLTVDKVNGISLLWGLPNWGALLRKLPTGVSGAILTALDAGAGVAPALSDVLVAVGTPKK